MAGDLNADAVSGLISALEDNFAAIRRTAAINLGRLGFMALPAIPHLARVLSDLDVQVRQAAAQSLGEIGFDSLGALIKALEDDQVRPVASRALRLFAGPAFDHLVVPGQETALAWSATGRQILAECANQSTLARLTESEDEDLRIIGLFALSQTPGGGSAADKAAWEYLSGAGGRTALAAAAILTGGSRPKHKPAQLKLLINCLVQSLIDDDRQIAQAASGLLKRIGRPAVSHLIEFLVSADQDILVRQRVITALGEIGPEAASAVPDLLAFVDQDSALSVSAVTALGAIGGSDEAVVAALIKAVGHVDTQRVALAALGQLEPASGPAAGRVTNVLLAAMQDPDSRTSEMAQAALIKVGARAIPHLTGRLNGGNPDERAMVLQVLSRLDVKTDQAVPALIKVVEQGTNAERIQAARALVRAGAGAERAVPALTEMMRSGDPVSQQAAIDALGAIGPVAVPILCEILREFKAKELRAAAIAALGRIPAGAPSSIPLLMEALLDKDSAVQYQAAEALQELGPAAAPAVPELVQALMHNDRNVRSFVAGILGKIGPEVKVAIRALIRTLKYGRVPARKSAALILAKIAHESPEIIPALTGMLRDQDKEVVIAATIALGNTGKPAAAAAPKLIRAIAHRQAMQTPSYRRVTGSLMQEISSSLVKMSPASVPAMITALRRSRVNAWDEIVSRIPVWGHRDPPEVSKPRIRKQLIQTLGLIGPAAAEAVPVLIDLLQADASVIRAEVAETLKNIGQADGPGISKLRQALRHRDPGVRAHAAGVLGKVGREARLAVPGLVHAIRDRDTEVRKRAIETLGIIGPQAREAAVPLLKVLDARDSEVAHTAAAALAQIGPTGDAAVSVLIKLLKSRNVSARSYAAQILGNMGAGAVRALPDLNRLASDKDPGVAEDAAGAVAQIQAVHSS